MSRRCVSAIAVNRSGHVLTYSSKAYVCQYSAAVIVSRRQRAPSKLIRKLHERRWRDKLGLFFVEGEDAVAAATAEPVDLLVAGEDVEPRLLAEVVDGRRIPPRVIAVYRRADLPSWRASARSTLALWRVADPGNVGTLIRTADAFGAAVSSPTAAPTRPAPKALRASAGSIWRVPLGPGSADRRERGSRSRRTAGSRSATIDLSGPVTFLLGAERDGLPDDVERDVEARIPIKSAESLNVAVAGAIALYEWRRAALIHARRESARLRSTCVTARAGARARPVSDTVTRL